MSQRPHQRLPEPVADDRWKSSQLKLPRVSRPGVATQRERFDAMFERLRNALSSDADIAALRSDPTGLAPNRGLVFVTAEPIQRIHEAIEKAGLNFVIEAAERFEPDNIFFYDEGVGRQLDGRLYVTMPNEDAFRTLISLYDRFANQEEFERGLTPLRHLFELLIDIRPWSMRERVSDATAAAIVERLRQAPDARVRLEIEIYPGSVGARQRVLDALGEDALILREANLPDIRYHGFLVEISPDTALSIAERVAGGPSESDDIFLIEPHSVVQAEPLLGAPDTATAPNVERPLPTRAPRAAVLDGMPITEHPLLRERLIVVDPDGAADRVIVANRRHGTAISSLIALGELPANEPPLDSRVLVRPVLTHVSTPDLDGKVLEQFDADKLTVEIVNDALNQFFGENPNPNAADVFVVNVSLGDRNRPAGAGPVSGWARLLDWWSATAGVLFIVSTGNDTSDLALQDFANYNQADDAAPETMNSAAMRALIASRAMRPVLSPAEGINVFTVGAAHSEAGAPPTLPSSVKDPLTFTGAPSLITRGGPGIANAMKPDVLMPGGRTLGVVRATASGPALKWTPAEILSGQQSAGAPDAATQPFPVGRSHGSSNAAALATRLSVRAVDNLMVEDGAFPEGLDRRQSALLAKCLIGHAAAWGPAGQFALQLVAQTPRNAHQERRAVSDLFGYGFVDAERALSSTDERITLLDVGVVRKNQGIVYQFAPPQSLSPSTERRIITGTVAWFTPVQATRRLYRQAELFIDDLFDNGYALGVDPQSAQPMEALACRGTIWTQKFDGARAIAHGEDDLITLRVSCRETYPGALSSRMDIYYAVALTIEVGADVGLPIYDDVMAAIEAQNIIRARERVQV